MIVFPCASFGPVDRDDGFVEVRDGADVCPESSVPHSLDDLTQLGTIGLDNKVNRQAVDGPRLGRSHDGHQRSSGSNYARGPLLDVATNHIKHQIDAANVFHRVVRDCGNPALPPAESTIPEAPRRSEYSVSL